MSEPLQISTIADSKIKQIAINSNIETPDNDTIESESEWRQFMFGIAEALGSGQISLGVAKKYVDLSSSIFVENDKANNAYKEGYTQEMNSIVKQVYPLPILRKINNNISPNQTRNSIIVNAETKELEERLAMLKAQQPSNNSERIELNSQIFEATSRLFDLQSQGYNAIRSKYEGEAPQMGI